MPNTTIKIPPLSRDEQYAVYLVGSSRKISENECAFARFYGFILLMFSLMSLGFNYYSLVVKRNFERLFQRDKGLVLGMFISSFSVTMISLPPILMQSFLCRSISSKLLCLVEGVNSFLNGCSLMYMLVTISVIRFIVANNSRSSIDLEKKIEQYNFHLVIICFIMGAVWSIPPIFGFFGNYAPEGLGLHCGLNWSDKSLPTRIYFFLLFINVYFIPILIVKYVSYFIKRRIRHFLRLRLSISMQLDSMNSDECKQRHLSTQLEVKTGECLHRLDQDQHFVRATQINIIIYIIAWTPYSIVALGQIFGFHMLLSHSWVITTCGVFAKLSMITYPTIYIFACRHYRTI